MGCKMYIYGKREKGECIWKIEVIWEDGGGMILLYGKGRVLKRMEGKGGWERAKC